MIPFVSQDITALLTPETNDVDDYDANHVSIDYPLGNGSSPKKQLFSITAKGRVIFSPQPEPIKIIPKEVKSTSPPLIKVTKEVIKRRSTISRWDSKLK